MRKHITGIGLELEGGWKGEIGVSPFPDVTLKGDGSVRASNACPHYGECESPVFNNQGIAEEWLRSHYPNKSDESCGFHIHISFDNLKFYSRLMTPAFHEFLKSEFTKWGRMREIPEADPFWKRLRGGNSRYCADVYDAETQVRDRYKSSSRYAQLNYCYGVHRTLELRMLPMFADVELGVGAMKEFFRIVETWLRGAGKERIPEKPQYKKLCLGDVVRQQKRRSSAARS